jgi:hypothetical protein
LLLVRRGTSDAILRRMMKVHVQPKIPTALFLATLCACAMDAPPDDASDRTVAPASRPVPERDVLALANDLVSLASRRGFDVRALDRALDAGNSVDVCRALTLPPAQCEVLGARVHAMGLRIDEAGVIGDAARSPRGCSDAYSPCCQVAITRAALTGRFPAIIAGQAVFGVLQCHCRHCPRGRLGPVCDAIPGA